MTDGRKARIRPWPPSRRLMVRTAHRGQGACLRSIRARRRGLLSRPTACIKAQIFTAYSRCGSDKAEWVAKLWGSVPPSRKRPGRKGAGQKAVPQP